VKTCKKTVRTWRRIGKAKRRANGSQHASNRLQNGRPAGIKARVSAKLTANQERASQPPTVKALGKRERHPRPPIVKPAAKEAERAPAHKTWGGVRKLVVPEFLRSLRVMSRAVMGRALLKCRASDPARAPELMGVMNVDPPLALPVPAGKAVTEGAVGAGAVGEGAVAEEGDAAVNPGSLCSANVR
jgi:hypothetical protein